MLNILKKYFFLIIIITFLFLFYCFELNKYFTLQFLQQNHLLVEEFIHSYPLYSFFGFYVLHLLLLACFIPASLGIFITAGFLFHPILAEIVVLWMWGNAILGAFNMLPFGPLDGAKVKKWSEPIFWLFLLITLGLVFTLFNGLAIETMESIAGI